MSVSERPGVYTNVSVSSSLLGAGNAKSIGLAAVGGESAEVKSVTSYAQAAGAFGADSSMAKLAKVLFANGAGVVRCASVLQNDYAAAFASLMKQADVGFMVCDSAQAEVHKAMCDAIAQGDEKSKYRLGVVETDLSVCDELAAAAQALNSERMVLVSHHDDSAVGAVAAAVCAAMAAGTDPAVPLNGAVLHSLGGIGESFSDADITLLVRGGVLPVESVNGTVSVVRGVTTRTRTGDAQDDTWREVNTVLIVNSIIPELRDGLRAKFSRAKNTAQTRGAIRTEVVIALEDKLRKEIIESYGDVRVTADEADPTVCNVEFSFAVAHGMNKIELTAYITV